MIERVAGLVSGRRTKWAFVAAWIVLLAVFGPLGAKLGDVTNEDIALPASSQSTKVNELLRDRFAAGDTRTAILVYERDGGLTAADRQEIEGDARAARGVDLVGQPIPPFGPGSRPGQVSRDGDVAFTVVPIVAKGRYDVVPTIDALRKLASDDAAGLQTHVTGDAALLSDVLSGVRSSDGALLLVTIVLVLGLLVAVYRSPLLALVPLVTVGVAYAVASGIVYLLARNGTLTVDTTATSLLLILMFGAGTDYCLLLVSRYRSELREAKETERALGRAVGRVGPAVLASGATVGLALLAMLVAELGLNHTLGPVNAIGIAVVMLASLTLLPALLSLLGRRGFWPRSERVAFGAAADSGHPPEKTLWGRAGARVQRRPVLSAIAAVCVLGACAFGMLAYHAGIDPSAQFRKNPDSKQGVDVLRSRFPAGSLAPVTVLVERDGGQITSADVALVQRKLAATPGVAVARDTGERSRDGRIAALSAAFSDDPYGNAAMDRVADIRRLVAHPAPGLTGLVGHGSAARLDYLDSSKRDLRVVAPLVLAVVLVLLAVLLRALVAPLFLLASVVLSFLGSLGLSMLAFRYLFDQPNFDPEVPFIVFIFLVALGSDYTIFLMSSVREEAAKLGTRTGLLRALVSTGPVITSAGLILAGTFAALTVLPLWLLFQIGFAVAVGVLLDTFLVRSVLVPALTWLLGERSWWPGRASVDEAPQAVSAPEPS
jgi:RND superfamily putative drug exporter